MPVTLEPIPVVRKLFDLGMGSLTNILSQFDAILFVIAYTQSHTQPYSSTESIGKQPVFEIYQWVIIV
jgi:hypothetical protein